MRASQSMMMVSLVGRTTPCLVAKDGSAGLPSRRPRMPTRGAMTRRVVRRSRTRTPQPAATTTARLLLATTAWPCRMTSTNGTSGPSMRSWITTPTNCSMTTTSTSARPRRSMPADLRRTSRMISMMIVTITTRTVELRASPPLPVLSSSWPRTRVRCRKRRRRRLAMSTKRAGRPPPTVARTMRRTLTRYKSHRTNLTVKIRQRRRSTLLVLRWMMKVSASYL
mmetsp:Transcript_8759/g.20654  ORF Transcript_8759/g.20654 Transcript_8759/m.20654 type:complete len:224 (+) Transcript_8759:80-751(+)